jgi:hypothetical protein
MHRAGPAAAGCRRGRRSGLARAEERGGVGPEALEATRAAEAERLALVLEAQRAVGGDAHAADGIAQAAVSRLVMRVHVETS